MAKILLVDDNEMNRDMLVRRLGRSGYELIVAKDGREGLEKAIAEMPDLILMDLCLPGLDGLEATQQLKKDKKTQNIPLIVLTARVLKRDREEALLAGCDDYDNKPIDFTRLLGKIKRLLGKRKRDVA
jgi:CheY-like chemotaxis protein